MYKYATDNTYVTVCRQTFATHKYKLIASTATIPYMMAPIISIVDWKKVT